MRKVIIQWLPYAFAGTVLIGLVYGVLQQNYRLNANDPQIEVVRQSSELLAKGYPPSQLVKALEKVDMSKSLSYFVMTFDDGANLIESSGYVASSTTPLPPKGSFEHARDVGENRVTWQTVTGLRFATVIRHWQNDSKTVGGFVVVARSLSEIEDRELGLEFMVTIAWIVYLFGMYIVLYIISYIGKRNMEIRGNYDFKSQG